MPAQLFVYSVLRPIINLCVSTCGKTGKQNCPVKCAISFISHEKMYCIGLIHSYGFMVKALAIIIKDIVSDSKNS